MKVLNYVLSFFTIFIQIVTLFGSNGTKMGVPYLDIFLLVCLLPITCCTVVVTLFVGYQEYQEQEIAYPFYVFLNGGLCVFTLLITSCLS
jgi:hypothetical protein